MDWEKMLALQGTVPIIATVILKCHIYILKYSIYDYKRVLIMLKALAPTVVSTVVMTIVFLPHSMSHCNVNTVPPPLRGGVYFSTS